VKEGSLFVSELGQVFEIVRVTCEIKRSNGETFTLDASTLDYLKKANMIFMVTADDPKCS
jgi:hypothetical protein